MGATIADQPEELTMNEIIDRHQGEWILMRVTEDDDGGWPAKGYLLARAPSQAAILEAMEQLPRADSAADGRKLPYYSFRADPELSSGPAYEAIVKEFFADLAASQRVSGG